MAARAALLCLVCTILSACGGGGGGGGDGGAANNTPPPQPPPPAFALTEVNAIQAAAYALAPLEQLLPAQALIMNAAAFMRVYNFPEFTTTCSTTPPVLLTITYSDRDGSGNVSVGDVINAPALDCAGLRRKLTLTLTQMTATLDQMAGRLEVDIEVDGMKIVGAYDASLLYAPATNTLTWRIQNAMVTVTKVATTQTVRLTSGQFVFAPAGYSFTLTGGSVESEHLGGTYTFSTPTPLGGAPRKLPSSGELLLGTVGGSRARITPPATPSGVEETVEYAVAATSSGAFAPTQSTLWTAIVRGLLFGWRPNEAPTLTNVQIQPPNPAPGAFLSVSYNAQDINGDALSTTFEWRRNGTVVGNTQFVSIAPARNDNISVTVTVSDGRLSATATASVTIGNPPPVFTTLTIAPAQPNTTVDLVAVPNVYEPDGDPVTLTYEWTRNGAVIANRTAATLPASETTRNDVISVRASASDGATTVERTASTTIVDAPTRVSVLSPPSTVAHGEPVTFTATMDDPDGDPVGQLDFKLAYGPAGMTVNPTTGVVTWTASGPMFDRTMDINWGITINSPSATAATGTLQVTDSSRNYPLLRFGIQIPTWPHGLSVGDFDDDGSTEMIVMGGYGRLYELEFDGAGSYRQSWAYPYALHTEEYQYNAAQASVATGDSDGDDKHEIFTAVGRTITKLDGVERRRVASRELPQDSPYQYYYQGCADFLYGDVEDDGEAELLCLTTTDYQSTTSRILVLRPSDLSTRYEFPPANYGRSLAIGNVDSDAAPEIVTAGGYVFDGATLANQWTYTPGFGMDVDTGDLDGDGVEEIVAAADWSAIRGYSATLRSPMWEVQGGDLDSLHIADIGGDARPEILVGDGQWGNMTIYRYNSAANTAEIVDQISSQEHGVTSIAVANVDDDPGVEVIWGSGYSSSGADVFVVAKLTPDLAIDWTNESQLDGPFRGGTLAGSALKPRAPLFLSTRTNSGYAGSRLVSMSTDGNLEVSALIGTGYYGINAVDVVDYDNDTNDEAFLAHESTYWDGTFRAYDFFSNITEWSSGEQQDNDSALDVTHADLTGDGKAELIGMTTTGVIHVHDLNHSPTLVWKSTTLNDGRRVFAADVDGDAAGTREIVGVTAHGVYVYRRNVAPVIYVQSAIYLNANRNIIDADVGDTDGDGDSEIVLLTSPSGGWWDGNEVLTLDANLQLVGTVTLPWDAETLSIEPSETPKKNLLVSRLGNQPYNAYDGVLAIVDSSSGGIVFESPSLVGAVQRDSVHYVTLPGETQQRMSIGTGSGMYLTR